MNSNAKYPKIYFIITLVLFILSALICILFALEESFLFVLITMFWLILPLFCPAIIWLIERKANFKHPKVFKVIAHIVNIINIIFQCVLILIVLVIIAIGEADSNKEFTNAKDYQRALNNYTPEMVAHFPRVIPENAKNVKLFYIPGGFTGDSSFYLQFDIDNEYIQKERDRYKNKTKEYVFKNENNKNKKEEFDYDKYRAANAISECYEKSGKEGYNAEIGYRANILEGGSCISGFATKDNNIIYLVYCD